MVLGFEWALLSIPLVGNILPLRETVHADVYGSLAGYIGAICNSAINQGREFHRLQGRGLDGIWCSIWPDGPDIEHVAIEC